jgi:hypothetical protein
MEFFRVAGNEPAVAASAAKAARSGLAAPDVRSRTVPKGDDEAESSGHADAAEIPAEAAVGPESSLAAAPPLQNTSGGRARSASLAAQHFVRF